VSLEKLTLVYRKKIYKDLSLGIDSAEPVNQRSNLRLGNQIFSFVDSVIVYRGYKQYLPQYSRFLLAGLLLCEHITQLKLQFIVGKISIVFWCFFLERRALTKPRAIP
jgi:hypothetical protein